MIGGDFDGHVSDGNRGDQELMGKSGVKDRNVERKMTLGFAKRMEWLAKTYFKREEHRASLEWQLEHAGGFLEEDTI